MRTCSAGACTKPAKYIGAYTDHLQERKTKAACSPEHVTEITNDLEVQGFRAVWREFNQPEDVRKAAAAIEAEPHA